MTVNLTRLNGKVQFQADNGEGNTLLIDGAPRVGGEGLGFRPMQVALAALASCSVMDLVHILKRQREDLRDIRVTAEGDREEGAVPSPFTAVRLHYHVYGALDESKVRRAVQLAVEKYCSVVEMMKESVDISWDYSIHPAEPAS